ncbi:MAG: type II/IV secretion system ATPase subunit [Candidatus Aenigmarchaeota archaeon]|nr:type II/IV secretion system ATPase subunit [Candidatus Aenigmarchaeota archaeon]MDW8160286.1 type II/IV secretion system ATPase subunit [Candidatus Aenigmarchaeota archaeon]
MEFKAEIQGEILIVDIRDLPGMFTIEDFPEMMEFVNSMLFKHPYINRIVIKGSLEEAEYFPHEVEMLKEVAETYRYFIDVVGVNRPDFFPNHKLETRELMNLLLKDPLYCYLKTISRINSNRDENYKKGFLLLFKNKLEETKIIKLVKDEAGKYFQSSRDFYRKILLPIFKPNFVLSRVVIFPPKNSILLEKYFLKDKSEVGIYKIVGKIDILYNLVPKEFLVSLEDARIIDEAKNKLGELGGEVKDYETIRRFFLERGEAAIREISTSKGIFLTKERIRELGEILLRNTAGFGVLEHLLQDDKIQDIYVNSPVGQSPVFINHADFGECITNIYITPEEAESWATKFRLYSGRPLDEANPVLDTEITLPFGRARVAAITKSLSQTGLAFAFRRHREKPWTFPLLIKAKSFNPLFAGLMSFIIDGGRSVLVAGGRGSGKTSLLSSMVLELMRKYRIIILEDTPELPVEIYKKLGYNVQHLKCRSVITHVETEMAPEEALRTALRLGDSALLVGEVRSKESTVLFESMRIGALANLVAGTIHGESAYGVYDRVVNDLGLVPTSFKALDIIVISNVLKSPDGLRRFRRVVEVVEVRKKWKNDPMSEGAFVPLLTYSAKEDTLKPTDVLLNGESDVLNEISKRIKEWHGAWDKVWENILLRGKIKQTMVEYAEKLNRPDILEAEYVVEANEAFHNICDEVSNKFGHLDAKEIYEKWLEWFEKRLKS